MLVTTFSYIIYYMYVIVCSYM